MNEDIYRINKLTTTDKALYRFYVADKSVLPIYLRELSQLHHEAGMVCYSTVPTLLRWLAWLQVAGFYIKVNIQIHWESQIAAAAIA